MANIPFLHNAYFSSKVGIGTETPATELQIGDYTDATETITIATSTDGTGRINFYDNNATEGGSIRVSGKSNGGTMYFASRWNTDTDRVTFDLSQGYVGIGTNTPSNALEIGGGAGTHIVKINSQTSIFKATTAGTGEAALYLADGDRDWRIQKKNNDNNLTIRDNTLGSDVITFEAGTGNVGIGTTSPGAKLHIKESIANTTATLKVESASWNAGLQLTNSHGTWEILNDYTGLGTTGALAFYNAGYRMVIDNTGNVGIGVTSPVKPLQVNGIIAAQRLNVAGVYARRELTGTGHELDVPAGYHSLIVKNNGSEQFRINSSGNVGIGTTNPGQKLHLQEPGATSVYTQWSNNSLANNGYVGLTVAGELVVQNNNAISFDTGASYTERMNISSAGAIQFNNYDSTNNTGTPTYLLGTDASGNIVKTNTVPGSAAGPYLPLAGGTLTGFLSVNSSNASGIALTVNGEPGNGLKTQYILSGGGQRNWQIGMSSHASQTLSITPSSASGSTTFTTPILNLNGSDNNATFAGDVSLTSGSLSITADGLNAATLTESSAGLFTIAAVDDIVLDAGGDIALDAGGDDIRFRVNGTTYGSFNDASSNLNIYSTVEDKDIKFWGNDGGSTITALTLDMSNGGAATFAGEVTSTGGITSSAASPFFRLTDTDNSTNIDISSVGGALVVNSVSDQVYQIGGTEKFRIASSTATFAGTINSSNIYITDTTPEIKLTDSDTSATFKVALNGVSTNITNSGTNGEVAFHTFNGEKLRLNSTGVSVTGAATATTATTGADNNATLTTKGYVDGLVTGVPVYKGTWNASGTAGGTPDLRLAANKVLGNYYIVSTAGSATPNGATTEPDSWNVGDWCIFSDVTPGVGTDLWQKIDNTSVISGAGTGQSVTKWDGTSGAPSETLTDGPITFSGNNSTITGKLGIGAVNASFDLYNNGTSYLNGATTVDAAFTQTGGAASTFSGSINITDNQPINYSGQTMFIHTGSTTKIGDSTSSSVLSLSGGNATFAGNVGVGMTAGTIPTEIKGRASDGKSLRLWDNAGTDILDLYNNGTNAYINTTHSGGASNPLIIQTNSITALTLDTSQNATFAGDLLPSSTGASDLGSDALRFGNIFADGGSIPYLTSLQLQLQGNLTILNKAQSAYIPFATRNTTGSEVVMDLTNVGSATFGGDVSIAQTADVGVLNVANLDSGAAVGLSLTYPTSNVAAGDGLAIAIGIAGRGRSYIANSNVTNNLDASNLVFYTEDGGIIGQRMIIDYAGNVGIGTTVPAAKLDVAGGIRMANDSTTASVTNVGTQRYRETTGASYVDMVMKTGAATYEWINIVRNVWAI